MEFMYALQHGFDDHKPSLFELLSEQQLSGLIPPSLRYLLTLATHRRPRYLLRVLNSFDELYALLALLVERHYLITYGGSFTEHFYGLKRERVLRLEGGEAPRVRIGAPRLMRETLKLSTKDVWSNLAIMIGLPYIKRKLDESYDIHAPSATILGPSYNRATLPHNATGRQRILHYYKWFLRNVYPSINAAYYFSILAFSMGYLFHNSRYSSPFLWMVETRIRRIGEADQRAIALAEQLKPSAASQPGARPGQGNSIFNPATMTGIIYQRLLSSLKVLLPTSIFALKFLEWWHASDFARQLSRKAVENLELPPPLVSGSPKTQTLKCSTSEAEPRSANSLQPSTNTVSLSSSIRLPPSPPSSTPRPPTLTSSRPHQPTSSLSHLPILTVAPPSPPNSPYCPICLSTIENPTAAQTGYVFCYSCIFKWVDGSHQRQDRFMEGNAGGEEGWGESGGDESGHDEAHGDREKRKGSGDRMGKWESGQGRCAVTGRRVLGGTEGLRRIMV
ncbi:MAG: ubiquitin-protein ligase peroxin 12 [Heterodermia speciosa]|uniref:Peroxisome assembly protein 12 n=1 Tax=Heterodermia speciosa TaxID=116794 RepID=A0A8H3FP97_9LECA|nr:MAG: ubiquitin-protein ligase peroxin 12 [Heterodermia speciosa]